MFIYNILPYSYVHNYKTVSLNKTDLCDVELKDNKYIQNVPVELQKAYTLPSPKYKKIWDFNVKDFGKISLYELSNGHKVIIAPNKKIFISILLFNLITTILRQIIY